MQNVSVGNANRKPMARWIGYVATVLLEAGLTAGLILLNPALPLAKFPMPYILIIMVVAYVFGEGPAVLAFFLGLFSFTYFFVNPVYLHWPFAATAEGWARLIAFSLGTVVVGFATILVRRSKRRVDQLVAELDEQRNLLEAFMQHVPVGLGFHDRDTYHLLANRALAEISREAPDSLVGKTVWEALPQSVAAEVADDIAKVFLTGEATRWIDKEMLLGGERYFDIQHMPVRSREGELIGVGAVVMETTDQVKARRQLEQSYEREHHIAEALQESILGSIPSRMACFAFEAAYQAASDEARVGGDFYDVFSMGPHKVGIVIGDVSGKGLKAAIQVAMVKYSIRGRAYETDSPARVLEQVNEVLIRDMDDESFITAFVGVLDCEAQTLTYANGGHEPAIRWDSANSEAVLLDPTGPLIGMDTGIAYEERVVHLDPSDEILLSTDGLLELQLDGRSLSIENVLATYTAAKQANTCTIPKLIEQLSSENSDVKARDDIAVLRVLVAE